MTYYPSEWDELHLLDRSLQPGRRSYHFANASLFEHVFKKVEDWAYAREQSTSNLSAILYARAGGPNNRCSAWGEMGLLPILIMGGVAGGIGVLIAGLKGKGGLDFRRNKLRSEVLQKGMGPLTCPHHSQNTRLDSLWKLGPSPYDLSHFKANFGGLSCCQNCTGFWVLLSSTVVILRCALTHIFRLGVQRMPTMAIKLVLEVSQRPQLFR